VSTADHAERPLRAPSSGGGAPRGPYADGGSAGVGSQGDSSALRRMAESGVSAPPQDSTTAAIPVYSEAPDVTSSSTAASYESATYETAAYAAPAPAQTRETPTSRSATPASAPADVEVRDSSRHAAAASTPPPAAAAQAASSGSARTASARPGPRRVRLTVSRVDPWSAMKISFLLSVALGIAGVVMVFVLWTILAGMGVFDQINGVVGQVVQDGDQRFDIMDFVGLGRVLSLSIVIAVIDVILVTAIATLAAFLYNVSSALVGGVQLTLTDD
jgi:hypothetical protein